MEAAEKKLVAEEAVKAELCRDLSELVAQSADAQLVSHRPQAALLKGLPACDRACRRERACYHVKKVCKTGRRRSVSAWLSVASQEQHWQRSCSLFAKALTADRCYAEPA